MNGQIEESVRFDDLREAGDNPRLCDPARDWRDMMSDAGDWINSSQRSEEPSKRLLFVRAAIADLEEAQNAIKDQIDQERRAKLAERSAYRG